MNNENVESKEDNEDEVYVESSRHKIIVLVLSLISVLCTGVLTSSSVLFETGSVELSVWICIAFISFFFAYTSSSFVVGLATSMFFGEILTLVKCDFSYAWEYIYILLALVLFAGYGLIASMLGLFLRGVFGKKRKEIPRV